MNKFKSFTRKELKEPDEFITFTGKIFNFLQLNYKMLSYVLIGVAFIALILFAMRQHSIRKELKAADLFNEAMKIYSANIKNTENSDTKSDSKDDKKESLVFGTTKEKYTKAIESFQNVIDKYPNSSSGKLSKIYLAHSNYFIENYDAAIELYTKNLNKFNENTKLNLLIYDSLGHSYENKGDFEKAIEFYDKILEGKGDFLKDYALYNIGRCHKANNDSKKAKEFFERVMKDYPKSRLEDAVKRALLLMN